MLPRVASVWRSLRAALITLLLALGFIAGWPKVSPKLSAKLPPGLAQAARNLPDTQRRLLEPFAPVADVFGIESESWAVFATTGGIRHRLWVEARARRGHAWTLLHRAQDDEHAYLRDTLEYRRLRVLWNPHRYGLAAGYPAFTRWLARRVFLDFPGYDRVRVRQEQVEILPRGAGFRSTGAFAYELEYSRRELLP